jgi:8-oxo-dGTP diphosphatase
MHGLLVMTEEGERLVDRRGCVLSCVAGTSSVGAHSYSHLRPGVAVDAVVLSFAEREFQTYLVRPRAAAARGRWACPGGRVAVGETLDDAARRELRASGLANDLYLEQLFTFGNPSRDPAAHVISVAYLALVADPVRSSPPTEKYLEESWFRVSALPALAYDHALMVRRGIARVQAKLGYTNIACNLLPRSFCFSELEALYSGVLGRALDRRNFRRRIMAMGILRQAPGVRRGNHRPAQLYRFLKRDLQTVQIL